MGHSLVVALLVLYVSALPETSLLYGKTQHLSKADAENSLEGVHFTIVTTEDPPFISVRDSPGAQIKPWQQWSGWIPELIKETAAASGFTYTLQLSSSANTYAYGASDKEVIFNKTRTNMTATYAEANQGGFGETPPDVHWAGAYITTKRRDALEMTAPFDTAPLSLAVLEQVPDIWAKAGSFLQPFSLELWVLLFGMAFMAGLMYMFLEYPSKKDHFKGNAFSSYLHFWNSYADSMYMSGVSIATQLESFDPTSSLGKIFVMLWSFWCLLVITAYTANLAAYMASTKVMLRPSSLAEFLEPNSPHKACVLANSAYAAFLKSSPKYGVIEQVPASNLFAMADAMKEGKCHGIIERKMHVRFLESLGKSEGYPVKVVDDLKDGPLHLSVMLSDRNVHVRDSQATRKLSYWITHLVGMGIVAELYQYEVLRLDTSNKAITVSGATQYSLRDFFGVIIMYVSLICLIFLHRVYNESKKYIKHLQKERAKRRKQAKQKWKKGTTTIRNSIKFASKQKMANIKQKLKNNAKLNMVSPVPEE